MKQEDIQLLLVDLCGRLPYGVKVTFAGYSGRDDCILNYQHLNGTYAIEYLRLRPYLRPMSSMTDEEVDEFTQFDVYADGEYVMPASTEEITLTPKAVSVSKSKKNKTWKSR